MTLEELHAQGFDLSFVTTNDGPNTIHVKCSQCEALVINGTPSHKRGCPNVPRKEHAGREPYEYEESDDA